MNKKLKKAAAAVGLSVAMATVSLGNYGTALVPLNQTAAEDTVRFRDKDYEVHYSGNYGYIVVDKEAVIMKYTGSESSVSIPKELDGMKVTTIGWDERKEKGAFEGNSSIQTVTVPGTITLISSSAFEKCSGLQQVLIGEGVKEILSYAFYGCEYLQTVKFQGNTLTYIGDNVFDGCSVLDDFKIPSSVTKIGEYAFACCKGLSSIVIPDSVETLGGGAFFDCENMTSASIGNGVTEINSVKRNYSAVENTDDDRGAFENCYKLEEVKIGSGVTSIGTDAFAGSGIKTLTIPDNVTNIGQGICYNCDELTEVTIGDGVKTIGYKAFSNCEKLKAVSIGKNVRTMGDEIFSFDSSLEEITIPSSVETLGAGAFYNCKSLKSAVIGNGVTALSNVNRSYSQVENSDDDYGTFENCTALSNVSIGDGVKTIGTDAFANTALTKIIIPDNVVTIAQGAFYNCKVLEDIEVGDGTTSIGDYAFYNCEKLKNGLCRCKFTGKFIDTIKRYIIGSWSVL